jgi:hypothetical protein
VLNFGPSEGEEARVGGVGRVGDHHVARARAAELIMRDVPVDLVRADVVRVGGP